MPAHRTFPAERVTSLLATGKGATEIVRILLHEDGLIVEEDAIRMHRLRSTDLPRATVDHSELIPWRISERRDQHKYPALMLRCAGRARAGRELNTRETVNYELWHEKLIDKGWVVHYDRGKIPAEGTGWLYVPARAVDTDLIRDPYLDDGGNLIPVERQVSLGLRNLREDIKWPLSVS